MNIIRRILVRPRWLVKNILELTKKRQLRYSEEEKAGLMKRRLAECLELLTARSVGEGDRLETLDRQAIGCSLNILFKFSANFRFFYN